MRRYIVLLLITGIVWAQTDYDKLVLKNGKEYLGEYVKTEKDKVYFNSNEEYVFPLVRHKRKVQTLQLKDGTFVINNPPRSEWTIKEKAVYDAKKEAAKAVSKTKPSETPSDKKTWKWSEIQKMKPDVYAKFEDEIDVAHKEGRIV